MKDVLNLYREFLRSLPESTDWNQLIKNVNPIAREERRNKTYQFYLKRETFEWLETFKENILEAESSQLDFNNSICEARYDGWYRIENPADYGKDNTKEFSLSNNKVLKEWFFYDPKSQTRTGVYVLGDFYIGQSKDIRNRAIKHANYAINPHKAPNSQDLYFHMFNLMRAGKPIPLTILSTDVNKEAYFIELFKRNDYPLFNTSPGGGLL